MRLPTVVFLLAIASCGGQQLCVPGMSQSCYGPGACLGGQMCLADGSGYSTCNCGSLGTGAGFVPVGGGDAFGGGVVAGGSAGGVVAGGSSSSGGTATTAGGSTSGGAATTAGGTSGTGGGAVTSGGTARSGGTAGVGGGTANTGGGSARTCTLSQTCPVNTCVCGDLAAITSQYCLNGVCQSGAQECARACTVAGHPPPGGGTGGGSAGGGSAGSGGGSACNGAFALGSNFTTGSELYVQCNQFPSPTNCLTGKYINFEGLSGPLAACYCYAVCPNGVGEGQQCLSGGDGGLVCHRVRSAGGSMAFMCLPPGPAWQNLCR